MPRFIPSLPFQDCWGSVGNTTFFHRDGVCFYKMKPSCPPPGSSAQLLQLNLHHRALEAWRSISDDEQLEWNRLSVDVPSKRPPFVQDHHISGYNLFVSAYHGFSQLGREHVPDPAPYEPFPDFFLDFEAARIVEASDLLLSFFCSLGGNDNGFRYRLLLKLELASPGAGRKPGRMRNFLAEDNLPAGESSVCVEVSDYRSIWDLDLDAYQVHCDYLLLDSFTGYRCRSKRISFLLLL